MMMFISTSALESSSYSRSSRISFFIFPTLIAATFEIIGISFSFLSSISFSMASSMARYAPVIEAVLVPPSA